MPDHESHHNSLPRCTIDLLPQNVVRFNGWSICALCISNVPKYIPHLGLIIKRSGRLPSGLEREFLRTGWRVFVSRARIKNRTAMPQGGISTAITLWFQPPLGIVGSQSTTSLKPPRKTRLEIISRGSQLGLQLGTHYAEGGEVISFPMAKIAVCSWVHVRVSGQRRGINRGEVDPWKHRRFGDSGVWVCVSDSSRIYPHRIVIAKKHITIIWHTEKLISESFWIKLNFTFPVDFNRGKWNYNPTLVWTDCNYRK